MSRFEEHGGITGADDEPPPVSWRMLSFFDDTEIRVNGLDEIVADHSLNPYRSCAGSALALSTEQDVHTFKTHHYDHILIKNFYQGSDNAAIRFGLGAPGFQNSHPHGQYVSRAYRL